jgi:lysophospholipase
MYRQNKEWETRESAFAAFATGPLTDFWRQREEAEFTGVDNVPVRFVRFHAARHDRVIVVCPGRIESYVKYAELAYDLFHLGFDVLIIDHRGQGRSGRLLEDSHRGHVVNFSDYVDDLTAFWEQKSLRVRGASVIFWRTQWGRDCHALRATLPTSQL